MNPQLLHTTLMEGHFLSLLFSIELTCSTEHTKQVVTEENGVLFPEVGGPWPRRGVPPEGVADPEGGSPAWTGWGGYICGQTRTRTTDCNTHDYAWPKSSLGLSVVYSWHGPHSCDRWPVLGRFPELQHAFGVISCSICETKTETTRDVFGQELVKVGLSSYGTQPEKTRKMLAQELTFFTWKSTFEPFSQSQKWIGVAEKFFFQATCNWNCQSSANPMGRILHFWLAEAIWVTVRSVSGLVFHAQIAWCNHKIVIKRSKDLGKTWGYVLGGLTSLGSEKTKALCRLEGHLWILSKLTCNYVPNQCFLLAMAGMLPVIRRPFQHKSLSILVKSNLIPLGYLVNETEFCQEASWRTLFQVSEKKRKTESQKLTSRRG